MDNITSCNQTNINQITPSILCNPYNSNQITPSKDDDFQQTMLYGFVLKTKLVKNRIYWYAYRWDGTKDIWLYIGTDKNQATAKIEKYLRQE